MSTQKWQNMTWTQFIDLLRILQTGLYFKISLCQPYKVCTIEISHLIPNIMFRSRVSWHWNTWLQDHIDNVPYNNIPNNHTTTNYYLTSMPWPRLVAVSRHHNLECTWSYSHRCLHRHCPVSRAFPTGNKLNNLHGIFIQKYNFGQILA